MKLPSENLNNYVAFIVLAALTLFQLATATEPWSIIAVLGVLAGGTALATLHPYMRKILQGKCPPGFKTRYAYTAITGQVVAYYALKWYVELGLISTNDIAMIFFLGLAFGFTVTALLNSFLAWLKPSQGEQVIRVASHWLIDYLEKQGLSHDVAVKKVEEFITNLQEVLNKMIAEEAIKHAKS